MIKTRKTLPLLATLVALTVPASVLPASPAGATAGSPSAETSPESILVTGTGQVSGKPDTLTANFGVETSASTVGDALNRANAATARMRDALVRGGLSTADAQTSDIGITARRGKDDRITGYTVNQGLVAKIRNLPKAGALISAAVAAGGDAARLNGVSFAIEDDAALLTEARKKAFADARAKAEVYAHAAGRPLGRVVRVSEDAPGYSGPMGLKSMTYADASVPIEPGRQQLSVTVTVEWALNPVAPAPKP
ncbi:SIMPL domain-containing protein [Actinoplanes sp. L3-i22]|uniref:SIMPL domain-containing protein n=1 Tax=Actinoplanes sp. L3-i22 TaxID=2836373 RepID=UPI001C76B9F4|nr:SIMPL domain-containing protein [Actinoplanes sp. L3-i22]BCY11468.1 putative conserved lipoprotein LpqG [Actinoplanes sp. L3-i22]